MTRADTDARDQRYRQVLRTYTTRPAFRRLAAAVVAMPLMLMVLAAAIQNEFWTGSISGSLFGLSTIIFLPLGICVIGAALIVGHLRRQMESWRPALLPGYRPAHLLV